MVPTSLLYHIYVEPTLYILKNDFYDLNPKIITGIIFFWIYILSHHNIQIPTGPVAEEIQAQHWSLELNWNDVNKFRKKNLRSLLNRSYLIFKISN